MVILATKLHIPPPRDKRVSRVDLANKLNEGMRGKLTLVSAPAGFGKTTLLSEWATSCGRAVAWLSLDYEDTDQARFLAYLIAAFQTIVPDFGVETDKLLQSPEPIPSETILTLLLNEIGTLYRGCDEIWRLRQRHSRKTNSGFRAEQSVNDKVVLVLDDYHLIDTESINDVLTFIIDHLPPQLHIVIATRELPKLPLARLRAQGQLTELRASELRFTFSEVAKFLNQVIGLNLTSKAINTLEARTEGWVTGLQLAAISLQGNHNKTDFIDSFSGSHHFVLDYLVEEVLQQQPKDIQNFLLCTSILERLCGSLCDALLPSAPSSGQEILEYLERANLLLVPLDNKQEWYRYHHLLADALQVHLFKGKSNEVVELHLRASIWYEQNDLRPNAIHHALAAKDFERAADLIESEWLINSDSYFQPAIWYRWVQALPDELVRTRAKLSISLAFEMLISGQLQPAADRLRDANRLLEMPPIANDALGSSPNKSVDVDDENTRFQRTLLSVAWAFHAQALGDRVGTIKRARQALKFLPESNQLLIGLANSMLGLAYWTNSDLEEADKHMAAAIAYLRKAGSRLYAISCAYVLANIKITQGRLFEAVHLLEATLNDVTGPGKVALPGTADLHLGLSLLYREQGKADDANQHLMRCEALGKQAALPEWPYALKLAQARFKEDQGKLDDALKLIEEAEQFYREGPVPNVRPVAALKTRLWIKQGRLADVHYWVRSKGLSIEGDLTYLHEFEHITLARLLLSQSVSGQSESAIHEVLELLARLRQEAEKGDRNSSLIEILILQALAYETLNQTDAALISLQQALTLAEPQGYVRIFLDEGIELADLVSKAASKGIMPHYSGKLLALFETEVVVNKDTSADPAIQPLIEPLSQRELEVLQLIAEGYSNQEISKRLHLVVSTVKGHNQRIFGKLQVQRRTEAVARARELGILLPSS